MFRSKKIIVVAAVVVALIVAGSLGGVALAQTASTGNTTQGKTLLARVAAILGIDQQKVEDAFQQAQKEARDEALDARLKSLVEQGKITQEQANQYKSWLQARPDLEPYRQQLRQWQQTRPNVPAEFKEWLESRPDVPFGFGFGGGPRGFGMGGFRGIGGGFGWEGTAGTPVPPASQTQY